MPKVFNGGYVPRRTRKETLGRLILYARQEPDKESLKVRAAKAGLQYDNELINQALDRVQGRR